MFTEYLQFQSLSAMQKRLSKTQNAQKNKELEKVIKSGLVDLDKRIKNMSDNEKKIEKPIEIVDAVVAILDCNEQNQGGQGLKILTPQQMLIRLPISLAQLKAGNNSEKLKTEIRQLLHSLYRSKNLSKKQSMNI